MIPLAWRHHDTTPDTRPTTHLSGRHVTLVPTINEQIVNLERLLADWHAARDPLAAVKAALRRADKESGQ